MVQVSLTVGKLDASLALLLTKEHHLIEFPTILLPKDVQAGSIINISCERDEVQEKTEEENFLDIQDQIMKAFGTVSPSTPELRIRNITETSAVLEWDPIEVATADIISLTLYKNGSRFGTIPSPLKRTAIKLSGLAIDTSYSFYLVLATTAGTYKSSELKVKTHKMTDLTGITICVGKLSEDAGITRADLEETIHNIGAKPLQDTVRLDTTHFICTEGEGPQWQRALDLNIPVVRPEWIQACENECRLVSVRAYYLNADPSLRPKSVARPRASSYTTPAEPQEGETHRRAASELPNGLNPVLEGASSLEVPSGVPQRLSEESTIVHTMDNSNGSESLPQNDEDGKSTTGSSHAQHANEDNQLQNGASGIEEGSNGSKQSYEGNEELEDVKL